VDIEAYLRRPADGQASDQAEIHEDVARLETTIEADDGQQFIVILLDADDSFDVVIHYPNAQREAVWSLVRERKA
jgi:hypothetical protein